MGRWFADDVIITCVRWYLRFKLSYRDLAELARELGVSVAPSTILRWVIRYVPEFEKCWQAYERPVGDSWRVDETYLKVGGQWVYLYRSVDKQGKTVESYLSRTRDVTAAKAFFRKRVFEKFHLGASRLSMRRMAVRSMKGFRSLDLQLVVFAQATISGQPRKRALHDPSQAHHLEGALPAFGDVQSPPVTPL